MTIANPASILTEFTGGLSAPVDYDLLIGVGVTKDSDAVFFRYEESKPIALVNPATGKPLQTFKNVTCYGIELVHDIGTFKATKLNLKLQSTEGSKLCFTSGVETMWSQAVVTALMGIMGSTMHDFNTPFTFWSKRGDQGMRPSFANIYLDGERVSDNHMYEQLRDLRSDRDKKGIIRSVTDAVQILSAEISGVPTEVTVLNDLRALPAHTEEENF
jgi:hypothetical protein